MLGLKRKQNNLPSAMMREGQIETNVCNVITQKKYQTQN